MKLSGRLPRCGVTWAALLLAGIVIGRVLPALTGATPGLPVIRHGPEEGAGGSWVIVSEDEDGMYARLAAGDKPDSLALREHGALRGGKRHGMWLERKDNFEQYVLVLYHRGQIEQVWFFNRNSEMVASCLFRRGRPYEGSYWSVWKGLRHGKEETTDCTILNVAAGKLVSEVPCDELGHPSSGGGVLSPKLLVP